MSVISIVLVILAIIVIFGIIRIIISPCESFGEALMDIFFLDLLFDILSAILEALTDN